MRPYRKPSEEGAIACFIVFILWLLFAPFVILYRIIARKVETPNPYTPQSFDDATQTPRGISAFMQSRYGAACMLLPFLSCCGCWLTQYTFVGTSEEQNETAQAINNWVWLIILTASCLAVLFLYYQKTKENRLQQQERRIEHEQRIAKRRIYTIHPPRRKRGTVAAIPFMETFASTFPHLQYQIVGSDGSVVWRLVDSYGRYEPGRVIELIRDYVGTEPYIDVSDATEEEALIALPFYQATAFFTLANEYAAPLALLNERIDHDPLHAITQHLGQLLPEYNERMDYTLLVSVASQAAYQIADGRYQKGQIVPLRGVSADEEGRGFVLDMRDVSAKLKQTLYHAALVVTVESQDKTRCTQLATSIAELVSRFHRVGSNRLALHGTVSTRPVNSGAAWQETRPDTQFLTWQLEAQHWYERLLVLSPPELASVWHLPDEDFEAESIAWHGTGIPADRKSVMEPLPMAGAWVVIRHPSHPRSRSRA